jgi:hypothetical protein
MHPFISPVCSSQKSMPISRYIDAAAATCSRGAGATARLPDHHGQLMRSTTILSAFRSARFTPH